MRFDFLRQIFAPPLFKDDYGGAVAKFLNSILVTVISVVFVLLLYRLVTGGSLANPPELILLGILIFNVILLFAMRRGYVFQSSVALVFSSWIAMTYQAWVADGVYDVAVVTYVIIILMTSVLTNWRLAVIVTVISVISVWNMALFHTTQRSAPHLDAPVDIARDLTAIFILTGALIYFLVNTLRESMERTGREFNERIHAERALHERDERFRKIFHVSPVAICVTALKDGRLIEANGAYWKLTGFDPQKSVGRTTVDLKVWDGEEARQHFVEELMERKSLNNPAYEFVNKNGERRVTIAFYELFDYVPEPTILSMYYDITEQREMQLALERSEARLRALLEAIPDMIFELKRDGTIVRFIQSPTIDPILPPEEFVGKTIAQVLPPLAEQTAFAIDRALSSGQLNAFEYHLPSEGEDKVYEARITPAGPDLVLAMVRDVSLNKWAESERENLIDELEFKNAELERFTYTVSHDLKSPLITIRGFLGFVREDSRSGNLNRLDSDIQRISDATDRMQRLLGDLLELSRIGRLANKPLYIPMNDLVNEVLEFLYGRINSGGITVYVADNLPTVYGDRQRIFEVLQNLIDNGAKFMGDQASPHIEIGQKGELNGKPIFFVRDNGIGIQPEYKDKIFGLFDKLDPQTEGTGIGLALVKRIVEIHGGRIWVESESGKGATFFFSLPSQPATER